MNLFALFGQITMPAEIVSVLGGGLVLAVGWQVKLSVALLREVAVLKTQLNALLAQCPFCKFREGGLDT